jgi:S1-C subfamily serine protease
LQGYPAVNSTYQALEGVFSSVKTDEEGRMRGSSGSQRGYSGGPIFNYEGQLLGINVANKTPNKFIGINGQSTVNELFSEISSSFPSLSVVVPAYFIASRYHKDCRLKT